MRTVNRRASACDVHLGGDDLGQARDESRASHYGPHAERAGLGVRGKIGMRTEQQQADASSSRGVSPLTECGTPARLAVGPIDQYERNVTVAWKVRGVLDATQFGSRGGCRCRYAGEDDEIANEGVDRPATDAASA